MLASRCACRGICIALDAGNLHETAYGVACHAEVVFESHFGSIFNLRRTASEELVGSGGRHSAGYTHLP